MRKFEWSRKEKSRIVKPRRREFGLPGDYREYTDIYFTNSREIIEKDGLNPWVRYQVFVREGPGIVCGIDEAIAMLRKYSRLKERGGEVRALYDGESFEGDEPIMVIEGPAQELIELETVYLSAISAGTTYATNMNKIVKAAEGKDVVDFGARHVHWSTVPAFSYAAWVGGAAGVSTPVGAETFGGGAKGTLPHALVLIYGSTEKAAEAFARNIEPKVVALIDTYNMEITDSIATAEMLGKKLYGVRIDTCGESIAERGHLEKGGYEDGPGVTIEAVRNLREALDEKGFGNVKIFVSSGFDAEKTRAFVEAEKKGGERLFDAIGTGSFLAPMHYATSDIVEKDGKPCAKVGREIIENPRLKRVEL